ncbi:MAG: hypothetical protein ACR2PL_15280 [Dehalococcoidia bacterium]
MKRAAEKLALIRRADRAARAYDPSIVHVDVTFVDEYKRVLIMTSDGRLSGDVQPMVRFNVSCLSEVNGNRQTASSSAGARFGTVRAGCLRLRSSHLQLRRRRLQQLGQYGHARQ